MMVINDGDGVLQFFDITWNGNTPVLISNGTSFVADARTDVNAIYQMAFDWGGNLVCAGKNIGIYSMPTNDNQSTTPAKSSMLVSKATSHVKGDVNGNGIVNMDDLTALINYLVYGTEAIDFIGADVNEDSGVGMDDLTGLIDILVYHY